jgi:hypothetical protein
LVVVGVMWGPKEVANTSGSSPGPAAYVTSLSFHLSAPHIHHQSHLEAECRASQPDILCVCVCCFSRMADFHPPVQSFTLQFVPVEAFLSERGDRGC